MIAVTSALLPQCQPAGASYTFPASSLTVLDTASATFGKWCSFFKPSYGLPAEGWRRWCSGCVAAEGNGAVLLQQQKKCEGCGLKVPKYGLPAERRRRWCSGCVAAEGNGAVLLQQQKMCEGCGLKHPCYGLPAERRARWCTGCAAAAEEGLGW